MERRNMATRIDRPDFTPINGQLIRPAPDRVVDIDLISVTESPRSWGVTTTIRKDAKTRMVRKHRRTGEWSEE